MPVASTSSAGLARDPSLHQVLRTFGPNWSQGLWIDAGKKRTFLPFGCRHWCSRGLEGWCSRRESGLGSCLAGWFRVGGDVKGTEAGFDLEVSMLYLSSVHSAGFNF